MTAKSPKSVRKPRAAVAETPLPPVVEVVATPGSLTAAPKGAHPRIAEFVGGCLTGIGVTRQTLDALVGLDPNVEGAARDTAVKRLVDLDRNANASFAVVAVLVGALASADLDRAKTSNERGDLKAPWLDALGIGVRSLRVRVHVYTALRDRTDVAIKDAVQAARTGGLGALDALFRVTPASPPKPPEDPTEAVIKRAAHRVQSVLTDLRGVPPEVALQALDQILVRLQAERAEVASQVRTSSE